MTIADRIKQIRTMHSPKLTQTEFGKCIGVSKDVVANLEGGRVSPSESMLLLIEKTFSVNPVWLETGEGDPFEPRKVDIAQEISDIMRGEDPFAAAVLTSLASMPPEWWQTWHDKLMQVIAEKNTRG